MRRILGAAAAWAALLCAPALPDAAAQSAPSANPAVPMWGPNEPAVMTRVGNTLYIGGAFDYIGPPTGTFGIVDATDATQWNTTARLLPSTQAVVADGMGGWFALPAEASLFGTPAGGATAVTHILPSGIDHNWTPPPVSGGTIIQIAVDGSRLYLAGNFTAVGGVRRSGLAALDTATGALLPFVTVLSAPTVLPSLIANGGVVYLAGASTSTGFAVLDGATGAAVPFATPLGGVAGSIRAASGARVYAGGVCAPQVATPTVCAYDRAGVPLPTWTPPVSVLTLSDLTVTATTVYVRSGTGAAELRAFDAATGAVVPTWTMPSFTGGVRTMTVAGSTLYVVGSFTEVNGQPRARVAALDATTGALLPWAPLAGGSVTAIAVAQGRVAIGGQFSSVGGIARKYLAGIDLTTGLPVNTVPPVAGPISAIVASGDLVVAVERTTVSSGEVLGFSTASGVRYPVTLPFAGSIGAVEISGSRLFLGGSFAFGAEPLRPLAAFDLLGGGLVPWNPVLTPPRNPINPNAPGAPGVGLIRALGGRLYIGGAFTGVDGSGRGNGAAFDLPGLSLIAWDPRLEGVNGLVLWQDRMLISGAGAQPGNGFGRLRWVDPLTGDAVGAPLAQPAFNTLALARAGDTLVVGGSTDDNSLAMSPLIAIDPRSGLQQAWDTGVIKPVDYSDVRYVLGFDDLVVVAGRFTTAGRQPAVNLAVFRTTPPAPPRNLTLDASQPVVTVGWTAGGGSTTTAFVIEAGSAPGLGDLGRFPVGPVTQVSALVGPGAYALRVFAVGPTGTSAASSEILFTRPASATPPNAPAALSGTVVAGVVSLDWTASTDAVGYVIEAGSAAGLADIAVLPTGALDTNAAGAVPAGTYFVRVRAANRFGLSSASNEVRLVVP